MSKILKESYNRLLVDISRLSGVSLEAPDDNVLEWLFIEGPLLDKQVLRYIEQDREYFTLDGEELKDMFIRMKHLEPLAVAFFTRHLAVLEFGSNPIHGFPSETSGAIAGVFLGYLRQCLLFCYKAEFEPTTEQKAATVQQFVECEHGIAVWDDHFERSAHRTVLFRETTKLISRVICKINWSDLTPGHGPGAVFPPSPHILRSKFGVIYESIEQYYPFAEYFCALPSFWEESIVQRQEEINTSQNILAKLVCVPKDRRGPRLICVHPAESVWIQQGHRLLLECAIERSPLTRGRISFNDQSVNGRLARESSLSKEYCTLDLREASDCMSRELIRVLFGSVFKYLDCCRATHVQLLDDSKIPLRKMFPMGNASTFPVESLVFWALVRAGIRCQYGVNCTDVYVFGDDIIFPSKYYAGAIRALVRAGLKPNTDKTFYKGFFRESCGVDAYCGKDVTPLRIRVSDDSTVSQLMSLCDLAKRFRIKGYDAVSTCLYSSIRKRIHEIWPEKAKIVMRRGRLVKIKKKVFDLYLNNNPDAQGIFEYVDMDFGQLVRYGTLRFSKASHTWLAPSILLKSVIDNSKGSWWNLQDSLVRLDKMSSPCHNEVSLKTINLADGGVSYVSSTELASPICEHGLEYEVPNLARPTIGWTPISMR